MAWEENGKAISTEPNYTIDLNEDREITATFYDGTFFPGVCLAGGVCQIGLLGLAVMLLTRNRRRHVM